MRSCHICGCEDFDINDALFYCRECGTQFAELCTQEKAEEPFGAGAPLATSEIKSSQPKTKKPPQIAKQKRTWLTHEAFNVILHCQVKSLIKIGASPRLADVVLQMWAAYLRTTNICFKSECLKYGWAPSIDFSPRVRDLRILCGENFRTKLTKRKSLECSGEGVLDFLDSAELPEEVDVDGELNVSSYVDEPVVTLNGLPESVVSFPRQELPQKFKGKRKQTNVSTLWMTLPKTLCFCYLGLLYLEDQILLSDLIRFAHEGQIPYMDAVRCLPEDMELCCNDREVFVRNSIPKMNALIYMSSRLARVIRLPKLKHPPLLPIASRLIRDLNLPKDILYYVRILTSMVPSAISWDPCLATAASNFCGIIGIEAYEVQAMAYIFIVLKLIFGLDDENEFEHSSIVTQINSLSNTGKLKLFVWTEWYSLLRTRCEFLKHQHVTYLDFGHATDVKSLSSYYYTTVSKWCPKNDAKSVHKCDSKEYRNSMRTVFSTVVSRASQTASASSKPTSFPCTSEVTHKAKSAADSHQYSLIPGVQLESLLKDFSSDSAVYSMDQFSKRTGIVSDECRELFTILKSLSCFTVEVNEDDEQTIRTFPKYWFINANKKNSKLFINCLPKTFKWLLEFSSKLVMCDQSDLYYTIVQTEKMLFPIRK